MKTKSEKALSILMLLAGALLVGFSMGRWLAPIGFLFLIARALIAGRQAR